MGRVKKTYRKKKKKSIFKSKIFWFFIIITGSVLGFLTLLLTDSFYQLETIEIRGVELTSEHSLRSFIENNSETIFGSRSLVFLPTSLLKAEVLSSYPHIELIQIEKKFPRKLDVSIYEREKIAVWCREREQALNCYKIDATGVAFERVFEPEGLTITRENEEELNLGEEVFQREKIDFLVQAKEDLDNDFDFTVNAMTIPHERSLFMETEEGFEIRFDFEDLLDDQIERLDILLSEEISDTETLEYIELRYGNSVYYR